MNVHRLSDHELFHARVSEYLNAQEINHVLQLGLLNTWLQTGVSNSPYLAYAEQGENVTAVLTRTLGYHAAISAVADVAAIQPLAEDLRDYLGDEALTGVIGGKEEAAMFVKYWSNLTGCTFKLNRAERIYRLKQVNAVGDIRGEYRTATLHDLDLITDWFIAFEAEAMSQSVPLNQPREVIEHNVQIRLESDNALRGLRLWVDNGEPVSLAGYGNPTPNGIRIGPVYTPPEHRGHGYASAITATLSQELLDQGRGFVSLFTDLANPTSNSIYQKIGYQPMYDVDEYVFA